MRRRCLSLAVAAAASVAAAGCGNANGLYPVSGKVLFKGEPAAGAVVYFHRNGVTNALHEQTTQGVVQEDGTFTLAGPAGTGAPPGEYVVLVEWKEGAGKVRGRSPGLSAPDRFRGRYLDAKKPLLRAEVKTASNTLPPFELN
jgi:hypothetical protein